LADISSFANTVGGDLIIGMTEASGIPTGFRPFPDYPDEELRRLDDMARTGLQPRISNLQTRAAPAPGGGYVIVVRIPRSYSQPHRVIHSNSNRFWARSSASPKRYEPNVEELRRIFNDAPLIADRVRAFRTDRLVKIAAQEAPITLAGNCLLALHVIPYRSVGIGTALSVAELESDWQRFPPLGRPWNHASRRHVNFDGFVVLANPQASGQYAAYAQVFRTGIVEAVSTLDRGDGAIPAAEIDKYCVASAKGYINALAKFGVGYPIAVVASLLGVKGRRVVSGIDNFYPSSEEQHIDRDQLHFTECIVESSPATYAECAAGLRRLLEQIWNTAGFVDQQSIRSDGVWRFFFP
jgi:Schlafen, AlbA_2